MTQTKTRRFDLRATARQESVIQQAAARTDRSVSEFILTSATIEAEKVLADRRWFAVTDEQFEAVQVILDSPLPQTSRFEHLWNRPSPFGSTIALKED